MKFPLTLLSILACFSPTINAGRQTDTRYLFFLHNRFIESQTGIDPSHITIVGTSKGGYIAQYVSSLSKNPKLNLDHSHRNLGQPKLVDHLR